ncbi:hypothetical protein CROQUDRAFT_658042 [Cronartium quercuum f. sp. fusiforme G11]|uniref:F-box domain-containing protein n=1 Tax=Cronartium quercuum f. sp. fusiforme G11 TaxID=708437 RepID=A0A9P6NHX7_9BASI|nr:hypothetical protein CROQUDRAFT_658042 [Cronartium quercuum f. sp. fusiforme G11]
MASVPHSPLTSTSNNNSLQQLHHHHHHHHHHSITNHMQALSLSHPSLSLATLTPEGTPPKAFANNLLQSTSTSNSILHPPPPCRAISPPTPAPSPQPNSVKDPNWSHLSRHQQRFPPPPLLDDPLVLLEAFGGLSLSNRAKFLNALLPILNLNELTNLSGKILPRLKRDFLRELPIEISLHILSFVDDPKTLMRAGMVSRFWRSLVSDEATWKGMCWRRGFNNRNPSIAPLTLSERMEKERKGRVETYRAGVEERRRRKKTLKAEQAALRAAENPLAMPSSFSPSGQSPFRTLDIDQLINPPSTGLGLGASQSLGTYANPSSSYFAAVADLHPEQLSTPYLSNPQISPTPFSRRNSYSDVIGSPRLDHGFSTDTSNQHSTSASMIRGTSSGLRSNRPVPLTNLGGLGLESTQFPHSAAPEPLRIKQPHRVINATSPEPGMIAPTDATSPRRTRPHSMPLIGLNLNLNLISSHYEPPNSQFFGPFETGSTDGGRAEVHTPTTASLHLEVPLSASSTTTSTTNDDTDYSPQLPSFSYKSYFKRAYLTESNWLRGPGELVTMQMSQNYDGNEWVVTSLGFDDDWIVVGMATSKIHVFSASTGDFVRTLAGHELGVWCLALVSKGGRRDARDPVPEKSKKGKGPAVDEDDRAEPPVNHATPSSEWISMDYHSYGHRAGGGGASMMRAKGGLGVTTWDYSPHLERHRSQQRTVSGIDSQSYSAIFQAASAETTTSADGQAFDDRPVGSLEASLLPTDSDPSSVPMRAGGRSMPAPMTIPTASDASSSLYAPSPSARPQLGRRRTSFGSSRTPQHDDHVRPSTHHQSGEVLGGMGLGAGGPSGGNLQQSSACGISRGWGQKRSIVVSGGCDRDVRVWDVETGRCLHVLQGHSSTIRCLKVLEGRPIAISGSRDSTLRVWDIESGVQKHLLAGHTLSVRAVEVHGNRAVSGSYDNTCRLWDVDTGECLRLLRGHYHQIYAVAFDGTRIASGSMDSTVCIWSAETGELLALLQGHTALVGQVQINGQSNVLVTGGSDGRVVIFSLESFECLHRLCAHDNSVTCLQFDDRFVVTGGNDGRVKLWDFKTGSFIRELAEPCEAVWRITLRDDKAVLLCKREGRTVMEVISFRPSLESI